MEMKQTIEKGKIYGFIGTGYSYGKGWGYSKITVVRAKINGYDEHPQHWNREFFEEVESTGKLHARGENTEFDRRWSAITNEYPWIIWM